MKKLIIVLVSIIILLAGVLIFQQASPNMPGETIWWKSGCFSRLV